MALSGPQRTSRYLVWLHLSVVLISFCGKCYAAEGGSGAYWPGFRNYMAGVVPSQPGWYFRNDVIGYTATAPRIVLNGFPVEGAKLDAVLDIVEPEYVLPRKLWGANHAIVLTQGFAYAEFDGTITGPGIRESGTRLAHTDTILSPLFLGWKDNDIHYNANLAIFIPTGDYKVRRVVNTGRNYWTFDLQFGATHFDPKTGWDFSGVLGYSINTSNATTRYRSGEVLHFDFAIGKVLRNRLKPGIAGYAWVQVGPDTGSGAIFGSFKSEVYGIGPIIQSQISRNSDLTLRYYHEFGAVNHLAGDQAALSFRTRF